MPTKIQKSALRYSIRIGGTVTSLSLRRSLVGLWLVFNVVNHEKENLNGKVLNFIYDCLGKWKKNNARGFSEFVSNKMIADILEENDFSKYLSILSKI